MRLPKLFSIGRDADKITVLTKNIDTSIFNRRRRTGTIRLEDKSGISATADLRFPELLSVLFIEGEQSSRAVDIAGRVNTNFTNGDPSHRLANIRYFPDERWAALWPLLKQSSFLRFCTAIRPAESGPIVPYRY